MNIVVSIIIFSIIIIIHELGHFLLAKKNGIGVVEFSVGLGPRLFSFQKGETRYSLKALPFGGSCMMLGEDATIEDEKAFNKKPVWARISVIAAGPIFNFILAFILALFIVGLVGYDPATVVQVQSNSPASEMGLLPGDRITKINNKNIQIGRELSSYLQFHTMTDEPVEITYLRDGKKHEASLQPAKTKTYLMGFYYEPTEQKAAVINVNEGMPIAESGIGIGDIITGVDGEAINSGLELSQYFQNNPIDETSIILTYEREGKENTTVVTPQFIEESYKLGFSHNLGRIKTTIPGVIKYSAVEVKYFIVTTVQGLGQLISGKVSRDDIAGPVGIVGYIGDTYEQSRVDGFLSIFLNLAYITILISANLGVMNLLPIPALDGGRLIFLFLEVLRGKPIDQEKEGIVHAIGLVLLMILMIFIMFNDISKLF